MKILRVLDDKNANKYVTGSTKMRIYKVTREYGISLKLGHTVPLTYRYYML